MLSFNMDLPDSLQPSPQPGSHAPLCQTGRYWLRAPLYRPGLVMNNRKDVCLVKHKIAIFQCQKKPPNMERELWDAKEISQTLTLMKTFPLCDAALQTEDKVRCSNLPQGLQIDTTVLSESALLILPEYLYNFSYYFSCRCFDLCAYLALAKVSCVGLFPKDPSLCPISSQGSFIGLRPSKKLIDWKG